MTGVAARVSTFILAATAAGPALRALLWHPGPGSAVHAVATLLAATAAVYLVSRATRKGNRS